MQYLNLSAAAFSDERPVAAQRVFCCRYHINNDFSLVIRTVRQEAGELVGGNLDGIIEAVNKKFIRRNLKLVCNGDQSVEAYAFLPGFHAADKVRTAVNLFGQRHLGQTAALSE